MKKSTIRILVIVTLVLSVFIAQNAFAETISGVITEISAHPNTIVLDNEVAVYGIRIDYLANQYNIFLEEGSTVTVEVYEFECRDGSIKLMASAITVGDATITLR